MKRSRIVGGAVLLLCIMLPWTTVPVLAQVRRMAPLAPTEAGKVQKLLPPDIALQSAAIDWANSRIVVVVTRTSNFPPEVKGTTVITGIWGPVLRKRPIANPGPGEAVVTTGGPNTYQYTRQGEQVIRFDSRLSYTIYEPFSSAINSIHRVRASVYDPPGGIGNPANNVVELSGGQRPPRPAPVPDYITSFTAKPVNDAAGHLRVAIKVTNPRNAAIRNLRLILVKGHFPLHEWKPLGLGAHAAAQVHWDDTMPAPGVTNTYEAILTNDLGSPLPPEDTILDRQTMTYRRGTTIIGTP
jgi:hypothetical protein